jgi:hypothetical protein
MEAKKTFYQIPTSVSTRNDYLTFSYVILVLVFMLLLFASSAISEGTGLILLLVALVIVVLLSLNTKQPALQEWILENVRCPVCHGNIKTCVCHNSFFPGGSNTCEVQCSNCNKKFAFKRSLLLLTLDGEIR